MLTFTHKHLHTFLITSNFLIPSLDATEDIGWGGVGWDVNVHTHTHACTHVCWISIYGCYGPGGLTILIQGWSHTFAALTPHVLCSSAVCIAEVSMLSYVLKFPFLFRKISLFLQILRFQWLHPTCSLFPPTCSKALSLGPRRMLPSETDTWAQSGAATSSEI